MNRWPDSAQSQRRAGCQVGGAGVGGLTELAVLAGSNRGDVMKFRILAGCNWFSLKQLCRLGIKWRADGVKLVSYLHNRNRISDKFTF